VIFFMMTSSWFDHYAYYAHWRGGPVSHAKLSDLALRSVRSVSPG
jgi:hypothetical protein